MTTTQPTLTAVALVARVEVLRTWRRLRTVSPRVLALNGSLVALYALVVATGTVVFTDTYLTGDSPGGIAVLRTVVSAVVLLTITVASYRTVTQTGSIDGSEWVLTATTPRAAALGVLVAEYARALMFHSAWLLGLVGGFTLVVDDLRASVIFGLVVLVTLLFVVTAGFSIGMAVRLVTIRSTLLVRFRNWVTVVLLVAPFVGIAAVLGSELVTRTLLETLRVLPVAWVADLVVAPLPAFHPPTASVAGGTALLLVGTPLLALGGVWLAERVWLDNGGERTKSDTPSSTGPTPVECLVRGRASVATTQVARKNWIRLTRSPTRLLSGLSPMLISVLIVSGIYIVNGVVPDWTTYAFAASAALTSGNVSVLNPMGDERVALPVMLTSTIEPREFLAGLVVVSWVVTLPLVLVSTVAAGLVTGAGLTYASAVGGMAVLFSLGVPGVGLAAGMMFPSFGTASTSGESSVADPSFPAFISMLFVVGFASLPLYLVTTGTGYSWQITAIVSLSSIVLVHLAGWLGFRYSAGKLENYLPDPDII